MLAIPPAVHEAVRSASDALAPWSALYGDSVLVSATMTFLHLGGVLVGGGFALAVDRATLRTAAGDPAARARHLGELGAIHRPVLAGLSLALVTGVLMLAADLESLWSSPFLWGKLGLVALLLGNGVAMKRAESRLRAEPEDGRAWRRLRAAAVVSAALWLAVLLAGTLLQSA